jgi:hypothetical protein
MCIEGLHVYRAIPSRAHDLGQPFGIVLVGFIELHLQGGFDPAGIKTLDIEAGSAQPMDNPGRHRASLDSDFCVLSGMPEHSCRDWIGV